MSDKKQSIKSADDLIVKAEAEKLGKAIPKIPIEENKIQEGLEKKQSFEDKEQIAQEEKLDLQEKQVESTEEELKLEQKEESPEIAQESSDNNEIDEYGTNVGKKKFYTEEEVNRMMRERFKRGTHSEKQQQEIKEVAKDFQPDPNSNEDWETQLGEFIDKHIENRNKISQEKEWRAREEQSMAEFEVKFSEGMTKYKDFQQIVANKPITQAMMLATRSMDNPAAFIYAACKQQSKEIQRISQIQDPMAQAVEMGRLEEKMRKARAITSSPKPAKQISGDASDSMPQLDIDARIAQHAKTKIMGHRR